MFATALLAQVTLPIPDIVWSGISPELALFGFGLVALLLDTAGENRMQAAFVLFGLTLAGSGYAIATGVPVVVPAVVALGGLAVFGLTALWRDRPRVLGALLCGIGFAAGLGATVWQWFAYAGDLVGADGQSLVGTATLIGDMVAVDGVALFTRAIICLAGLVTVPLGYAYLEDRRIHRGEYYPLLLFAATGMTLLASSADLIMVFIAVEILSLALYVLSGFAKRDLISQEAALKYFLLGAFSSALLLYGIALAYGVAGTTNMVAVGQAFASLDAPLGLTLASMALMLVGFGFKTALVPFHMWTPDVYQGAPTPVTGFMAAATKAAAFAAFLRVFVGAFGGLEWSWVPAIWVVAAVTMLVGAVLAVVQTDVKRMLGYSAITHAGYVMIGLIAVNREGVAGALFYLLVYAAMSLGSFGVLGLLERQQRKAMTIDDLRGLGRRDPLSASLLALFLLSLAGIPLTGGFAAKFAVFRAGIIAGEWPLVVIGVVSTVIAAYFYARVIVSMFFDDARAEVVVAESGRELAVAGGGDVALASHGRVDVVVASRGGGATASLVVLGVTVVLLGVAFGPVVDLATQAATFASGG